LKNFGAVWELIDYINIYVASDLDILICLIYRRKSKKEKKTSNERLK